MSKKKWERGSPQIPYEKNLDKAKKLFQEYERPSHEPIYFHKIRGSWNEETKQRYQRMHNEDNVKIMAKLGVQLHQRLHFYKGFGIDFEKSGIENTIQMAKWMHKHQLMVSVYIGGSMFTEYFFKEVPEAKEWARKTQGGEVCTYSSYQLGRYFPCLNNPEYIQYTYRVLDIAMNDVKADEIFFDNQILRHEPRSCRCDYCIKHLNDMIRKKYTPEECEERYGSREYPDMLPPQWSQANKPWRMDRVEKTIIQDWIDHRILMLKEFYQKMKDYVKKHKPDTAVGMNVKGIHGHNRGFNHGVDHGVVKDLFDFSCIDGYSPSYKNGVFWSEIRYFKAAHSNHMSVESDFSNDLKAIENQVFNYKKYIKGHGWLGDMGDCSLPSKMTFYCREIQNRLMGKEHCHDVAVLRSYPSVNYNCATVHEKLFPLEQTLIMNHVPFGIIFDENIKELHRHKVIILAEQQALSDDWLIALEKFVKAGGSVIATGKSAQFDAWYRPRSPKHGLEVFLGHAPKGEYEVKKIGKGVFVYIPDLQVVQKWNYEDWFAISGEGLVPVKNENEVLRALADASENNPLTYQMTGPKGLLPEAIWVKENKELDLHFVNYGEAGLPMSVEILIPKGCQKVVAQLVEPNKDQVTSIDVALGKTFACCKIRSPEMYSSIRFKFS